MAALIGPILAVATMAGVMLLLHRQRPRRTDPEDYARRSRYPAARADDEIADRARRGSPS